MDDRGDGPSDARIGAGAAPESAARPRALGASSPRPRAARLDAGALVAALWRAHPPDAWVSGRPWRLDSRGGLDALAQVATRADRLAARGGDTRAAARLLADTARAIAAILEGAAPAPDGSSPAAPAPDGALASPTRLRLARMERWLAARAAADPAAAPAAAPAADLCLWAVEHLEARGR